MAYRIRIQPRALAEIGEAFEWIERREPVHAARWLGRLYQKIETLAENPERCPLAAESAFLTFELRELLFGKRRNVYRILFTVSGDLVSILRVYHGARRFLHEADLE